MAQPVLVAVDNDPDILAALQRDLTRRFAADYRIAPPVPRKLRWPSSMSMIKSQ
jgi:hypothetical protein